jgi:hypothetical protein
MGIDYYTCQKCERNFPDCSYYFTCTGCEVMFCSDACGGRVVEEESEDGHDYNDITSCVMCRMETATSDDLLKFLLKHFNLTRDQAMEIYRKSEA